ncbi:MAG: nuclear transport factor 2 family protein [Candidatus Binataceae bacterium]
MADQNWDEAMASAAAANREMVKGNAAPLKQLYSHRDDITVLGGFGGFELGWSEVEPRLEWAASQFRDGRFSQREINTIVGTDLAVTVTIEHYDAHISNQPVETHDELRVTQVFRREDGAWRLVHRHGDPLVQKRPPD